MLSHKMEEQDSNNSFKLESEGTAEVKSYGNSRTNFSQTLATKEAITYKQIDSLLGS